MPLTLVTVVTLFSRLLIVVIVVNVMHGILALWSTLNLQHNCHSFSNSDFVI